MITNEHNSPGFDHISVLGSTRMKQNVPEPSVSGRNYFSVQNDYFKAFRKFDPCSAQVIYDYATFYEVKPDKSNVALAVEKNNRMAYYPKSTDATYSLALKFSKRYLKGILSQPVSQIGFSEFEFNGDASAGITGKNTGFPKTSEFLQSEPFERLKLDFDHIPVEIVQTKDEFLSLDDDLSRNKIRLVSCSDKSFLYKQKVLYDNQNKAMLDNCNSSFIKYGMTKQYGGFDRLISDFEQFYGFSLSDVSGYDKDSVLEDVYRLRNDCLIFPESMTAEEHELYAKLLNYVTYYTLNPVRMLPDGTIVQIDHSNSSGQNNTTGDNSILHIIISFDLVISLYLLKYGELPLYEEFMKRFNLAVYSDDKVLGLTQDLMLDPEDFAEFERRIYLKYGMTIKAAASRVFVHDCGTHFKGEDTLEFLGSTAVWSPEEDMYVPRPRVGKLCTSLARKLVLFNEDEIGPFEQMSKLLQIYSLLWDIDSSLKDAVLKFISFTCETFPEFEDQFCDLFASLKIDSRFDFSRLMSGYETGYQSASVVKTRADVGLDLIFVKMQKASAGLTRNQRRNLRRKEKRAIARDILKNNISGANNYPSAKNPFIRKMAALPITKQPSTVAVGNPRRPRRARKPKAMPEVIPWWEQAAGVAGKMLGTLGSAAGKALIGFGDYKLESNSLVSAATNGAEGAEVPLVNKTAPGGIRVVHREYLGDILSSTSSFNLTSYAINPGLVASYPWLSAIAANFEQYKIHGLVYEFKTLSSDYTGSPNLGYVAMATAYNAAIPASSIFPDKRAMENHSYSNSCKPSVSMLHGIECKRSLVTVEELYVRTGAVPSGSDVRLNDLGNFCIAVGGQSSNGGVLGELWASYDVEFFEPRTDSIFNQDERYAHYHTGAYSISSPIVFGTTVTDTLGLLNPTASSMTWQSLADEQWAVMIFWTGSGGGQLGNFTQTLTNLTSVGSLNQSQAFVAAPQFGVTAVQNVSWFALLKATADGTCTFSLTGGTGTLPSGTQNGDIIVMQVPNPVALKKSPKMYVPEDAVQRRIRELESRIIELELDCSDDACPLSTSSSTSTQSVSSHYDSLIANLPSEVREAILNRKKI